MQARIPSGACGENCQLEENPKIEKKEKEKTKKLPSNLSSGKEVTNVLLKSAQLLTRKNEIRKPERIYNETKIINGGRFEITKCAEFGLLRSTRGKSEKNEKRKKKFKIKIENCPKLPKIR